ncbi:MAG: guanylate kinase [Gammaproteobacteria bacterium]
MFVISAPSGTGKTTISGRLRRTGLLRVSISHTTRPPRAGERNGAEYFFVGRDEFLRMRDGGGFLEWAEVFGNYYGTGAEWVRNQLAAGADILLEIDVQGARQVKKAAPEAVLIFIRPPSVAALAARLKKRGNDAPEVVARRLAAAEAEIARAGEFDYGIINDDLDRAVAEIRAIIAPPRS